ncbi:MAG: hypothetical protein WBY66_22560, partial [Candidatus Acidiferrales bacterium]
VGAPRLLVIIVALIALGIQRRRRWNFVAPAVVVVLLIANAACGGGGGGSTGPTNPGTPKVQGQAITVTVSSGTISHNFTFILTVN